jgi:hypothetical protein
MPGTPKAAGLAATLKKIALRQADVEETIACKGTAIESAAYKTRKKSFLFVGADVARLKLDASVGEAKKLSKEGACEVGAGGWVAVRFGPAAPPAGVLERWVGESYELFAGSRPAAAGRKKKSAAKAKK